MPPEQTPALHDEPDTHTLSGGQQGWPAAPHMPAIWHAVPAIVHVLAFGHADPTGMHAPVPAQQPVGHRAPVAHGLPAPEHAAPLVPEQMPPLAGHCAPIATQAPLESQQPVGQLLAEQEAPESMPVAPVHAPATHACPAAHIVQVHPPV